MASGGDHPSAKRYDCFISSHGSQALSDLGFDGPGLDCTVRALSEEVLYRLQKFQDRRPSVFFDEHLIGSQSPDCLSNAVLQLRGGGVALVLLTAEYLNCKYCLAELRAFLNLERLRFIDGREFEAIQIRVVVLEGNEQALHDALQGDALKEFVGTDLENIQRRPLENRRTRGVVVNAICEQVMKIWRDNKGMCLGGLLDSVDHLAGFFDVDDCESIVRKLVFQTANFRELTVSSVFCTALGMGKFSDSSCLSKLFEVAREDSVKLAVAAF